MRMRVQLSSIYREKRAMSWRGQPSAAREEMVEKLEKDIEMMSKRVKHHEDGFTMLQTDESFMDKSILEMQDILEKYYISIIDSNEGAIIVSDEQSERETIKQILMHKNSADALYNQLKTRQHVITQCVALNLKDAVGTVAALGKVHDHNLSRLLVLSFRLKLDWKRLVLFFQITTKGRYMPEEYVEVEERLKAKELKKEMLLEDLQHEKTMLNCVRYNLEIKKREFESCDNWYC